MRQLAYILLVAWSFYLIDVVLGGTRQQQRHTPISPVSQTRRQQLRGYESVSSGVVEAIRQDETERVGRLRRRARETPINGGASATVTSGDVNGEKSNDKDEIRRRIQDEEEQCVLSSSGSYGDLQNQDPYLVSFYYQAVFVPETTEFEINDSLLPLLERAITVGILPGLFECPGLAPKGPVSGITMGFPDTRTTSGECHSYRCMPFSKSHLTLNATHCLLFLKFFWLNLHV